MQGIGEVSWTGRLDRRHEPLQPGAVAEYVPESPRKTMKAPRDGQIEAGIINIARLARGQDRHANDPFGVRYSRMPGIRLQWFPPQGP